MNVAVKVALSDDFLQAFSRLPRDKQQGVMRFLSKFRQNPTASGINYERIRQALDDGIHSVRIDQDYRGIVLRPENGNVYCLLWVDKHDNAYDWARRHRVAVNPELGNIQVFETSYVEGQDCLLYTSDAADERSSVDLGGRRLLKKKKKHNTKKKHSVYNH